MNVVSMLLAAALTGGLHHGGAPVTSTPAPGGCASGGCGSPGVVVSGAAADCGCQESKPGLFDRLRGLFSRGNKDCGCDPCASAPAPAPVYHTPASSGCGCASAQASPCDSCGKSSFFDRFRGGFGWGRKGYERSSSACCDGPAAGGYSAPLAPASPVVGGPVIGGAPPITSGTPLPSGPAHSGTPLPAGPVYHGTPAVNPGPTGNPVISNPITDKPTDIKKLPAGDGKVIEQPRGGKPVGSLFGKPEITPAGAKSETGVKNPFELDRRYEKRVNRAADYSKLTGQLCFVHADGGLWVLRYASLGTEDANGGSVVLARDSRMKNYREGDLISVEGEIISQRGSSRLSAPLYRVHTISLVDRPTD